MSATFNIYCDESCHLEHDKQPVMVLGALWCHLDKTREVASRLREIKVRHGFSSKFECKWTKVSPGKLNFYRDILDYFFDDDDLHFRALIIPDKSKLSHAAFEQSHDTWYYKMFFHLLHPLLSPDSAYHIYLDVKDTCSAGKIKKLHEVLGNKSYDFNRRIIKNVQTVRSDEVEQLQLCDLLIGAVGYANRDLQGSSAKVALLDRIRQRTAYSLKRSTLVREKKFNLFHWEANRSSRA